MLDDFSAAIGDLPFSPPAIPVISTLTGQAAGEEITDPGYWVRQVRQPVLFSAAITAAAGTGPGVFVEIGPGALLATAAQHVVEDVLAVPALHPARPFEPEPRALGHALARLHAAGQHVDWTPWFPASPAPRTVDLPTYAFQRQRYWLADRARTQSGTASGHPLLRASVPLADGGRMLTGTLSASSGGWPAQHVIAGGPLLPGSALVEWVLRAADEVGCQAVDELTLREPVFVPGSRPIHVQVLVDAPGEDGCREARVYSSLDADGGEWTQHATATLAPGRREHPAAGHQAAGHWPPAGVEQVPVDDFYERAAAAGYDYGPAFRGLRAVWRQDRDLLAEVTLPEAAGDAGGFGIHPAVLDAALQPVLLTGSLETGQLWLPFAWSGVCLHAAGGTAVRVRISPCGDRPQDGVRVSITDPAGDPVLTADSVMLRPASADRLRRVPEGLFTVEWTPLAEPSGLPDAGDWARFEALDLDTCVPAVVVAHLATAGGPEAAERALVLLQGWLEEPRLADATLALVTRGAVAADDPDLGGAAVWGLVRSAQSENPGRFILADVERDADVTDAVRWALAAGEPQVAVRGNRVLVPRMTHAREPAELTGPAANGPGG